MKIDVSKDFLEILELISVPSFFRGEGLGNEIAFYIYDYDPKLELEVRKELPLLLDKLEVRTQKKVLHIDLFELTIQLLKNKNLLERAYQIQIKQGNSGLLEALKGVVNEAILSDEIAKMCIGKYDLVFISGIGKSYPISRAHNLLNNLHAKMKNIPLIMFYPGGYNKQSLNLFNEFKDDNYYRAFKLIDRQEA